MVAKVILVLCAQALFVQNAFSYCLSSGNYGTGYGLAAPVAAIAGSSLACEASLGYGTGLGYGAGLGSGGLAIDAIPTSGGALPVSSISAIAPTGLAITSENVFEGALSVSGELPFVSAVALEGVLPSGGAGAVSYSCGNGVTAIESIAPSASAYGAAGTYGALGANGLGRRNGPGAAAIAPATLGLGYGSRACGCGVY